MAWTTHDAGTEIYWIDTGSIGDNSNNTSGGFIEWLPAVGNKLVHVGDLNINALDQFVIRYNIHWDSLGGADPAPEFKISGYGNFDASFGTAPYFELTTTNNNNAPNNTTSVFIDGTTGGGGSLGNYDNEYYLTIETPHIPVGDVDEPEAVNNPFLANRLEIECISNPEDVHIIIDAIEVIPITGSVVDDWTFSANTEWNTWNGGGSSSNPDDGSIKLGATGLIGVHTATQTIVDNLDVGSSADISFHINANATLAGDEFSVEYHNGNGFGFKLSHDDFGGPGVPPMGGGTAIYTATRTIGNSITSDSNMFGKLVFTYNQQAGSRLKLDNIQIDATKYDTHYWEGNYINPYNTGVLELYGGITRQHIQTSIEAGNYYVEASVLDPGNPQVWPLDIDVGFRINNTDEPTQPLTNGSGNSMSGTYSATIELNTAGAPMFKLINNNMGTGLPPNITARISEISVRQLIPYGGTVTDWNLQGDGGEIFYNEINTENFITFNDAAAETTLSQNINGSDFKLENQYRITFKISNYDDGTLKIGLFNDNGKGFEFTGISGNGQHSFNGTIGDASNTIPSLNNLFFLQAEDLGFTGDIDDITLEQIGGGKTISFSEKAKGWVSFKSFVPEYGISVSNQYYTMSLGALWKHHVTKDIYGSSVDRNTFYGEFKNSSVTPILNMQPEIVKNFNTLNYEGSDSAITQFTTDLATGLTDGEYYNLQPRKGWYIAEINTNKQVGTLNEFIEKEGKWFNYIKGTPGKIDPSAFNFQGLGLVQQITEIVEE